MSDWPLPPLYEPSGPRDSDEEVVRAFLRQQGPCPHSDRLHVEDRVLRVDGDMPLALWVGPRTILLLFDLPEGVAEVRDSVAAALTTEGLTLLDTQQPLGIVVGMQMVGARTLTWDLWGADIDEAFADLRTAAMGGEGDALLGGGAPPVF